MNQWFKLRNAGYAPKDTPESIRLIKYLKSDRFYRSSGAHNASKTGDCQHWQAMPANAGIDIGLV
jgi:hypothetical protein